METSGSAGKGRSPMGCNPLMVSDSAMTIRSLSTTNQVIMMGDPGPISRLIFNRRPANPALLVYPSFIPCLSLVHSLSTRALTPHHSIRSDPLHYQTWGGQNNFDIQ